MPNQPQVSLRTLGRIIGATRYVVVPYMRFPTLMDSAFAILRGGNTSPWSLRREVFRTLGILGALDPYKYRQIQLYLRSERLQTKSITAGPELGADGDDDDESGNKDHAFVNPGAYVPGVPGVGVSGIGSMRRSGTSSVLGLGARAQHALVAMPPTLGGGADGTEGAVAVAAQAVAVADAAAESITLGGGSLVDAFLRSTGGRGGAAGGVGAGAGAGLNGGGGGSTSGVIHGKALLAGMGIGVEGHGLLDEEAPPTPLVLLEHMYDGSQVGDTLGIDLRRSRAGVHRQAGSWGFCRDREASFELERECPRLGSKEVSPSSPPPHPPSPSKGGRACQSSCPRMVLHPSRYCLVRCLETPCPPTNSPLSCWPRTWLYPIETESPRAYPIF